MSARNTPSGNYAIVRGVAETLDRCVRTYSEKEAVNIEKAKQQHKAYCEALEKSNLRLIMIPADNSYPDCVFIEDTVVTYGQNAIICRMGATPRMGEVDGVIRTLSPMFKKAVSIQPPATIEGGDILKVEDDLFVGLTSRTDMDGIRQLKEALRAERCNITPVKVRSILHFKSACSYIGDNYIVANRGHFDLAAFSSFNLIILPKKEAYAANCLAVNGTVYISKGYPRTRKLIEKEGFVTEEVDVSEFKKCEGSITCLSIVF